MKKTIFLFTIIFSMVLTGNSRVSYEKFYFKLYPSYNFALMPRGIITDYSIKYNYGLSSVIENESIIKSSLGKGFLGNISFGYEHNDFISGEINFSYLVGKPIPFTHTYFYYADKDVFDNDITGNIFSITPTLLLSYKVKDFKPYLALGIPINYISFYENMDAKNIDISTGIENAQYSAHSKREYTGSATIGFITRIGVEGKVNEYVSVFSEAAFSFINWSPDKSEVTEYTINGIDSLSSLSTYERKTEYVDKTSTWYKFENGEITESINYNNPRKILKFYVPFSFTSISIGVKMNIGQIKRLSIKIIEKL